MPVYKISCSDGEKYLVKAGSIKSTMVIFYRTQESIENTNSKVNVISIEETGYKIPERN